MDGMRKSPLFKVLVAVDLSSEAGRCKLRGIYRFLGEDGQWDLTLVRSPNDFDGKVLARAAERSCDGFLIALPETREMRNAHARLGLPAAFIDYPDDWTLKNFRRCVFIHDDDRAIGVLAAGRFFAQGYLNGYGFAAADDSRPWNAKREQAFTDYLVSRGRTVRHFEMAESRKREDLIAWLRGLPSPAGVFAAYDGVAKAVVDACNEARIRIPDDIAVLGVGNEEILCEHVKPGISSIIPDFEEEGYRAARELQAMMLRPRTPVRRCFVCGTRGVSERDSTSNRVSSGYLVQQAMAYIEKNALSGITAADVVTHLRVSRRLLDLRFREIRRKSILEEILAIRLGRVRELLRDSDLRISEIAERCGCAPESLKNLFRRHFGLSMRDYRRSFQHK